MMYSSLNLIWHFPCIFKEDIAPHLSFIRGVVGVVWIHGWVQRHGGDQDARQGDKESADESSLFDEIIFQ